MKPFVSYQDGDESKEWQEKEEMGLGNWMYDLDQQKLVVPTQRLDRYGLAAYAAFVAAAVVVAVGIPVAVVGAVAVAAVVAGAALVR